MRTRVAACTAAVMMMTAACGGGGGGEADAPGWETSQLRAASSPVGLGDTVAVVNGRTSDLKLEVLDAETGEVRFSKPWSAAPSYPRYNVGIPALFDGIVVGIQPRGLLQEIVAWDSDTGKELWTADVSETFGPFTCGELVCSEDDWSLASAALVARDPATGETRWSSPGSQTFVYNSPDLLVESLLNEPVLRSIDPANGQERWRLDLRATMGPETRPVVSEAQMADGTLLVESNANPQAGNTTLGIDAANGSVKWRRDGFAVCPQPRPEVAVVCSSSSGLQRVNPQTGEPLWTVSQFAYPESAGPLLGFTPDFENLVVNETAEKLVAVGLDDGEVSEPPAGLSFMRFISGESGKKNADAPPGEYIGPLDPVPYNARTRRPAEVTDPSVIPDSVGFELAGTRIFMNATGGLHGIPVE